VIQFAECLKQIGFYRYSVINRAGAVQKEHTSHKDRHSCERGQAASLGGFYKVIIPGLRPTLAAVQRSLTALQPI